MWPVWWLTPGPTAGCQQNWTEMWSSRSRYISSRAAMWTTDSSQSGDVWPGPLPLPLDSFRKVPECDARASLVTSLSSLMVPCDDWLADNRAHWEVIPNEVVNVCWMSQDCTLIPVTTTHYWGRVLIAESWHKQGLGLLMVQGVPYGILCPPQCWA